MKKAGIAIFIVVSIVVYALLHNSQSTSVGNTSTPSNSLSIPSTSTSTPQSTGSYKDGTYTGSVADAYYGNIQVQATISGGRISNVVFLQAPNDRGRSVEINQIADPMLAQEAIQKQDAQVDAVSGATATSEAFIQSLSSALSQARS